MRDDNIRVLLALTTAHQCSYRLPFVAFAAGCRHELSKKATEKILVTKLGLVDMNFMSNYLAIATVTTALQQLLQEEVGRDIPGVQVTTVRPENSGSAVAGASINIYLYQATPNAAWRNADLRTRRPKGDLTKQAQAALDLHYLFTFYGNEQALEPQRLMGSAIRTLVDHPLLTSDMIEESITHSSVTILEQSTLGEQIQQVKFIPTTITTEDLSRIWSVFFQVPYALSFAYQATAILIQGGKSGQAALPVRSRSNNVFLGRPVLERVEHRLLGSQKAMKNTITLESHLVLYGRQLNGIDLRVLVQIGEAQIIPQVVDEGEIHLHLSNLSSEEQLRLRAGIQGIQVVQKRSQPSNSSPQGVLDPAVRSTVLPFVLCPQINLQDKLGVTDLQLDDEEQNYSGQVRLQVDFLVEPSQRVFLLLNNISPGSSDTYIFRSTRRQALSRHLAFDIRDVNTGNYLVRVQIDNAESPLGVDAQGLYASPLLVIE